MFGCSLIRDAIVHFTGRCTCNVQCRFIHTNFYHCCCCIQEKDKALEEVTRLKKEAKTKASQMEALSAELKKTKKEKGEIGEECNRVEAHRDHLLDKVERLHADKHNLEDRYVQEWIALCLCI